MKKIFALTSFFTLSLALTACNQGQDHKAVSAQIQQSSTNATQQNAEASTEENTEESTIVIDVRSLAEWNNGHLANAVFLPMDQLPEKISAIVPDKNQAVILYCQSGFRAGRMLDLMKSQGYTNVKNAGGIDDAAALTKDNVVK